MINVLKCWGRSIAAKALPLNCRWALALRCCSCRKGISFLLPEQKKRNKENSPSALFGLLRQVFPLNKKNSLTLKQLFVFHAPKSTCASRQKSEAGPFRFFRNIASLVGSGVFLFLRFALFFPIYFIGFRPPWKSVKKFLHFSVKKKKLFERSEFFFFRKNVKILALERQPANFFVSFLCSCKEMKSPCG